MYSVKELFIPTGLAEALAFLAQNPTAKPLAGGTDIIVDMRRKQAENVTLMALSKLEELKGIRRRQDGVIEIGALTTFTELADSPLIAAEFPMLKTAARSMGGPQIQNVATIGGNICNGATSADSAPALMALNAVMVLQGEAGTRRVGITDFYEGPGKVKRQPGELLLHMEIPPAASARRGDCYLKFSTRKAMDLALVSCAATCCLNPDGTVLEAALALGVSAPTPIRAYEAERFLNGKRVSAEVLDRAAELGLSAASPRSSWRASKEYREHMIGTLIKQAFEAAYRNAGGEE